MSDFAVHSMRITNILIIILIFILIIIRASSNPEET